MINTKKYFLKKFFQYEPNFSFEKNKIDNKYINR